MLRWLSITPGAATALVVRDAARGGRRQAFFTTSGNSIGVLAATVLLVMGRGGLLTSLANPTIVCIELV